MKYFNGLGESEMWLRWIEERPEPIRQGVHDYPPNQLYLLKPTGQKCLISSYCEDGTVWLFIPGILNNFWDSNLMVFGNPLTNLEPIEHEARDSDMLNTLMEAGMGAREDANAA